MKTLILSFVTLSLMSAAALAENPDLGIPAELLNKGSVTIHNGYGEFGLGRGGRRLRIDPTATSSVRTLAAETDTMAVRRACRPTSFDVMSPDCQ